MKKNLYLPSMKRKYLEWVNSCEYRKWEKSKKVYVFGIEGVGSDNIKKTMQIISDVIKELNLPLQVSNGNVDKIEDISTVKNLIASNTKKNQIDADRINKELIQLWDKNVLRYGLVILIDRKKYEFKNPPDREEPCIYGYGSDDGLAIIRMFDQKNVVKHEFGHMIGLGHHNQGCVMDWSCPVEAFCDNCYKEIAEIWA